MRPDAMDEAGSVAPVSSVPRGGAAGASGRGLSGLSIAVRLGDWLRSLRNAVVGSERFQHLAPRVPLLRGEANRRTKALFDLAAGFVHAQILWTTVELGLLAHLKAGPMALEGIAPAIRLPLPGAERLVLAAVALGLVEQCGKDRSGRPRFSLSMQGAALLANPGALAMIAHHKLFYADMADPIALLCGEVGETALSRYWAYARAGAPQALPGQSVADYSALMAASQPLVAGDILDAAPLEGVRELLDVGGGEGAFLAAAARRHPALRLALFDLPEVAERARRRFEEAGLAARATCHSGSFKSDPLPRGPDAISLIRVVHDHDDDVVRVLFQKCREALPPGGLLLIGEPLAEAPGAESMGDAYFGFYLLAMGSGRPRSADRLAEMLRAAGFVDVKSRATRRPLLAGVVCARRAPQA